MKKNPYTHGAYVLTKGKIVPDFLYVTLQQIFIQIMAPG